MSIKQATAQTPTHPAIDALKPCPFCGSSKVVIYGIRDGKQAGCQDCRSMSAPTYHGPDGWDACRTNAIRAWNRRAETT